MPRRVIINADDFGINEPRNRGIVEAALRGVVTSATLIINAPGSQDAVRRCLGGQRYGVGIHLNLTEGPPMGGKLGSLRGKEGADLGKRAVWDRLLAGKVERAEIRDELAAQIEWFRKNVGEPTHVDGHNHIHIFPPVVEVLAPLLRDFGIMKIRIPEEPLPDLSEVTREHFEDLKLWHPLAIAARKAYANAGLRSTDHFRGLELMGRLTVDRMDRLLSSLPEGTTELMVHPGYADETAGGFSNPDREGELSVLTHPDALRAASAMELIHYGMM